MNKRNAVTLSDEQRTLSQQVRLARQPIIDAHLNTLGYELLYRDVSHDHHAKINNSSQATASTVITALAEMGLDCVVGDDLAFINAPLELISDDALGSLFAPGVVLELQDVHTGALPSPGRMAQLIDQGLQFAINEQSVNRLDTDFAARCRFVKINVQANDFEQITEWVEQIHAIGLWVVAERIEDWETFDRLKAIGVDFFQGYFLSKPELVTRRTVRANKANLLSLLVLLQEEDVTIAEVSERINRDVALSYRLLRMVNSAAVGLGRHVDSLEEAVRMLGFKALRSLVYLSVLTGVDGKPPSLVHIALTRARFAELLAQQTALTNPQSAFLVGLFSLLDAFYDQPMAQLVEELPLSQDLIDALLTHEGALGQLLAFVARYERGEPLPQCELAQTLLPEASACYLNAVEWDEQMHQALHM